MDSTLQVRKAHSDFNQLLTWFLSVKSCYVASKEPWNIGLFAKMICNLYLELPHLDVEFDRSLVSVRLLDSDEYIERDNGYLKPVVRLKDYVNEELSTFVIDFLVHGSIATLDYSKGWSDLDTLVIVNSETLTSPRRLVDFRSKIIDANDCLLQIDPHQHHGFIYCTEFGLKQYSSHCMPIEVLESSKSFLSDNVLEIFHNRSIDDAISFFCQKNILLKSAYTDKILRHHKYKNKYLHDNYENMNAMYQLKYFLSIVMTLPALYLDAKGCPVYKKNSFDMVKPEFEEYWNIVDKASEIRRLWSVKESFPYIGNIIPGWVADILGNNYFHEAYELSNAMCESLSH